MQRLTITDALGDPIVDQPFTDDYPTPQIRAIAEREAASLARAGRNARWSITGADGRLLAGGETAAATPTGLLAVHTPVLYCETDAEGGGLTLYGTVRGVDAGCYVVAADHLDSGGRPVPIGVRADFRIPVDTPPAGALRTLAAVPMVGVAS